MARAVSDDPSALTTRRTTKHRSTPARSAGHRPRGTAPPGPAGWVQRIRAAPTATVLLALVAALCCFGLVMVGSASSVVSLDLYGSPWQILVREILWMGLGLVALVFACRIDYHVWRRLSVPLLAVTGILLLVVLLPGIGVHASGSSRWIGFGQFFRVQPSELMKLALAVFGADLIARRTEEGRSYRTMVVPLLLVTAMAGGLVMLQPDLGTTMVLVAIALALLFASGAPLGPLAKTVIAVGAVGLLVALSSAYQRQRLFSFLHPGSHNSSSNYQVLQSLIGLGSGHLLGLGLGNGRQKWGFLPNPHTDFIFSVVGEELGLLGTLCVLALLGALAWFGFRAAARAPDQFGGLLAVALVAWIGVETVINVGAVIGVLPVTGIPLPFISFGGSSLVITMLAAGVLVSIARQERLPARRSQPAAGRRPRR